MARYSVTVTVRLDADSEEEASSRVTDMVVLGHSQKGGFADDFLDCSVEEVENEDEMGEEIWAMASVEAPTSKKCKRCEALARSGKRYFLWTCRSCGAACCEHLCSNKSGSYGTCSSCSIRSGGRKG